MGLSERQRKIVLGVLAGAAALAYLVTGGGTVVVMNRTSSEICEAYFAFEPERTDWGRDRLWGSIPPGQSRDFHLPVTFGWQAGGREEGYMGRLVSCEGEEIGIVSGIEEKVHYWEAR